MHNLKHTRLVIFLLLCFGFSLNAQTVDETVAYLKQKLKGISISTKGDQNSGFYLVKDHLRFEEITGKRCLFRFWWFSSDQKKKRSINELTSDDLKIVFEDSIFVDLDKVNFSFSAEKYFKIFSDRGNKSINIIHRWEGDGWKKKHETPIAWGCTIGEKDEKIPTTGILKALKHLQKLLGCENNAQDQDERLKKMFED